MRERLEKIALVSPRLLAFIFFASGFGGLVYQVAWQRILTIPLGVGMLSTTLIVSAYMLGLGIGSFVGSRITDRVQKPCRLYALIEGSLGIIGFASVPVLKILEPWTAHISPAAAFLCYFLFLSAPTILMGITFPLLTVIFSRLTGDFTGSVSRLYFLNTLGASVGSIITGYVGVALLGLDGSIYAASCLNCVLALLMLPAKPIALHSLHPADSARVSMQELKGASLRPCWLAFIAGFLAIGYEVLWYRIIGILVKDSPYAFSTILAVYLFGVAIGSAGIRRYLARNIETCRKSIFYGVQLLIGASVLFSILGYYYLCGVGSFRWLNELSFSSDIHPALDIMSGISFRNLYLLVDVFFWPIIFLLVPAVLMGAGFPLIASIIFSNSRNAGSAAGLAGFFAISGNVLGGLATGLVLLPRIGTEATLFVFIMIGLMFGILPSAPVVHAAPHRLRRTAAAVLILLTGLLFPRSGEFYARMHKPPFAPDETLITEGLDSVVVTYVRGDWVRNFINGQGHGYRPGPVFYAEALEALSLVSSPARVLIIGFGSGSIVEAALMADNVEKVTTVELCESVIKNLQQVSSLDGIFKSGKLRLVIDDGRRFLQRSQEQYNVILMDPLRTTTAYSNNLHSRQFFSLARNRLRPDGILMVGGFTDKRIISRTLLEEFTCVRAYSNFSVASNHPFQQNNSRYSELLERFTPAMRLQIEKYRRDVLEGAALRRVVSASKPNDDWRPRSEYFLRIR
jgi:spermidine synthase